MNTTTSTKSDAIPQPKPEDTPKPGTGSAKPPVVTLDQLAREMKMSPRDARMLLRLAAKQKRQYPNLGKDHVPRQPWSWAPGSKALEEAKAALKAGLAD